MCRSIKQLRHPETAVSEQEIYEASLQFVRKISGFRKPSRANAVIFESAVQEIARVTGQMLISLEQPILSASISKQE